MEKLNDNPLMKQYFNFKLKYPEAIILFRIGEFYETFLDDAIKVSDILGTKLTHRAIFSRVQKEYIQITSFPIYSLESNLSKLLKYGQSVGIYEPK